MNTQTRLPVLPMSRFRQRFGVLTLFMVSVAYVGLFTQGQELFDNDYDWIAEAQRPWPQILREILRPIPNDWGFQSRPVQVACFKALHSAFGYSPFPYYAFKASLFGVVVCGIATFCLKAGLGAGIAATASGMFALSAPVYASTMWVSDFELLAQVLILAAYGAFLRLEAGSLHQASPGIYRLAQAGILLIALLGHRTKGSAKLIPLVLAVHLLVCRRDAIKRNLPLLAAITLTILPLYSVVQNPVPPFAPLAPDQSQGWMWKPANLDGLQTLVVGNAHFFSGTTGPETVHSLLGTLLPVPLWMAIISAIVLLFRHRSPVPGLKFLPETVVLCAVWLGVAAFSFASYPKLPIEFMARYVTGALIPACILIAYVVCRCLDISPGRVGRAGAVVLLLVVVAHGTHNFKHSRRIRESLGQVIVMCHRARSEVSRTVRNATVLMVGLPYSYDRALNDGNVYVKDPRDLTDIDTDRPLYILVTHDGIVGRPDTDTAVRKALPALRQMPGARPGYRVDIRPVRTFDGLTQSLYDRWIHASRRSFLTTLLKVDLQPIHSS